MVDGEFGAFFELEADPRFERFFRPVDPVTGQVSATTILRQREHRRVLIRRDPKLVTFVPDIPERADLKDAGYEADTAYQVVVSSKVRRTARDFAPAGGGVLAFAKGRVDFHVGAGEGEGTFMGGTASRFPVGTRVVNVTPPEGEMDVDPTTDWEEPDNRFLIPHSLRRDFVVRLHFSAPLDPRSVVASRFTVTRTRAGVGTPLEIILDEPVAVTTTLRQSRMGDVVVEIRPVTNLDPSSEYVIRVSADLEALDGTELERPFLSSFRT
jgi:hypothetical protein